MIIFFKMNKLAIIFLALLAVCMPQGHPPNAQINEMKLPRLWEHSLQRWDDCVKKGRCRRYFVCSYTAQTCEDGVRTRSNSMFIFALVDGNDRRTVIDRRACSDSMCLSFGTGEKWWLVGNHEQPPQLKEDLPEGCEPTACNAWVRRNFPSFLFPYPPP